MNNVSTTAFNDYASVQEYLISLKARGVKFGIDRMRLWTGALGHPERATPVIHIAGTNGKGSTAAMLDAIFREAGLRTGLYTSPHLVLLGERVQVNRERLTEREILNYTNELRPVAEAVSHENPDDRPSFFEFMTAMAFLQFARKKCDVSLIETGMGGRFDATNVVEPEVSVITSISLDHCEFLGDSVEKIAFEKAGIIKAGRPVVIGCLPPEAEAVMRRVAAERGSRVFSIAEEFGADFPETNLEGDHQRLNAATAALVARVFRGLPDEVIARGLQKVDWPGRWQRIDIGDQPVILDASHNPEGALALDKNLTHLRAGLGGIDANDNKLIIVTGALGAARARALLEVAARHARELHLVVPRQSRSCSFEELEALVPCDFSGKIFRATVEEIFPEPRRCALSDARAPIVVTGSIYLLGEVMARLHPEVKAEGRLQDF